MNRGREWAKSFPLLAATASSQDLIYFDNAATTHKPQVVLDRMLDFYQNENANIHRGVYQLAYQADQAYQEARQTLARFLGASEQEIIFTSGTTAGLNFLAERWIGSLLSEGDEIGLTYLEHHANLVPWQVLAQNKQAKLRYLPLEEDGRVDLDRLMQEDTQGLKVITLHHVSNVLGIEQDLASLVAWAHQEGIVVIVDGAQAVAHRPVNLHQLGVDAYCLSGHKLYGPTGIGVTYLKQCHHQACQPFFYGGDMIYQVGDYQSSYAQAPYKFEGGTPPIAQAVGLAVAVEWLEAQGWAAIQEHEASLTAQLSQGLSSIPGVRVYGAGSGIVSFNVEGVHPHDAASAYDQEGIALRAGQHCAQPLMRWLGQSATLRASLALYNEPQQVMRFLEVTEQIKEFFQG